MVKECNHPIRVGDMCACCGAEVRSSNEELFTFLHSSTAILVDKTEAERVNEEMYDSITKNRKLVLLLDLDQTVIHTSISSRFGHYFHKLINGSFDSSSAENLESAKKKGREKKSIVGKKLRNNPKPNKMCAQTHIKSSDLNIKKEMSIKEVREIRIDGFSYYVKPRDKLKWFLEEVSKYYEIHIYTMGNKAYASAVIDILDGDGKIFGNRIVTRDDNFGCFVKDIKRLFPTNSKHVLILDDRPDVWGFVDNLYPIRPYYFFQSQDINSPEALQGKSVEAPLEKKVEKIKHKKDLMDRIESECISTYFDNELERVLEGLLEVHREFFTKEQNIVNILKRKKEIFKGCVAAIITPLHESTNYLSMLFAHHGGVIATDKSVDFLTHVISSVDWKIRLKKRKKKGPVVKCVQIEWLCESVFALKRLDEDKFLLDLEEVETETPSPHSQEQSLDRSSSDDHIESNSSQHTLSDLVSSDDSLYRQIVEEN